MKYPGALLLLLTVACCAGPRPEPIEEAAVFQPNAVCRVSHDGGPVLADHGIGGTGISARTRTTDRGIGGTGIVGVVTGFASICVDGLEVRLDKNIAVSVNGAPATAKQLRAGQQVVIEAAGQETAAHTIDRVKTIVVRYEVSGPIEAVDTAAGAMVVAGQRVTILPTTWVAGRFALGDWTTVSGLRQPDGTVIASRLDRGRVGILAVRGQIARQGDTTRIGGLVLLGPRVAILKTGAFVSIAGTYANRTAEVTSIDADPLLEDPAGYFGRSVHQVILEAFVRVDHGMVWLSDGHGFRAGTDVQGKGSFYRNAVIRLERTDSGAFIASELHYTAYRAQPADAPARSKGRGDGDLVLPPDAPPGPPEDTTPSGPPDGNNSNDDAPGHDIRKGSSEPEPLTATDRTAVPQFHRCHGPTGAFQPQGSTVPLGKALRQRKALTQTGCAGKAPAVVGDAQHRHVRPGRQPHGNPATRAVLHAMLERIADEFVGAANDGFAQAGGTRAAHRHADPDDLIGAPHQIHEASAKLAQPIGHRTGRFSQAE